MPFSIQYVYYLDKVSELVRLAFNMTKKPVQRKEKKVSHTIIAQSERVHEVIQWHNIKP